MALSSISSLPRVLLGFATLAILCLSVLADKGNWTAKHEEGRCAIRGQCGKQSFFGGELPCPDNGLAEEPDHDTREKLVAICGDDWSSGNICCDGGQVSMEVGSTDYLMGLMKTRSTALETTSSAPKVSSQAVQRAKRTSSIYSAPLPARQTNLSSSTLRLQNQSLENFL